MLHPQFSNEGRPAQSRDRRRSSGGKWMTEDESLARFGFIPDSADLPAIREMLDAQVVAAEDEEDDSGLMKLCCIQLFAAGDVSDSMLIWSAKRSSFDNGINIDIQLLCGAGLARTKEHLSNVDSEDAANALEYIAECEASGDFERFAPAQVLGYYRYYYGLESQPPENPEEQ